MLTPSELVETVASDLIFVMEKWDNEIDDQSLRRSSPILRRLLVDGELQRAWKHAGFIKEPLITASTLDLILRTVELPKIRMASCGGASYKGTEIRGATEIAEVLPVEVMEQLRQRGLPEVQLGLRAFSEATCLVLNGRAISRRDLIKFVANRLGGVHSSSKVERKNEDTYRLLDSARNTYTIAEKPAVFFELLAAGQALARSEDLRTFVSRLSNSTVP